METRTAFALCFVVLACLFTVSQSAACCGDSRCDWPAEDCRSCPEDCGACPTCNLCGNRVCDSDKGETPCNCPLDCGPCCPDGVCREDRNETAANCPQDCALTIRILVIDEDTGAHLPGATVICTYPTATYGPVLTNNEGRTSFSGVAGGDYLCTGELFGYLPGYTKFTVYPLSTPQEYVIPLKQNPACLEGTVYDALTFEPLDNATVFCRNLDDNTFTTRTVTASVMGYFFFEPVPPGAYRCYGERINYFPNSNAGYVEAGKMATIDIYLNPLPGGIIGHVYNVATNTTVSGATVTCTAESGQTLPTQTTDANGFYHIPNVAATKVVCTASLADFTSDVRQGVVVNGKNTTINFYLGELPGDLQVTVVENGTTIPIANASVTCVGRVATTPENGTVLFAPVAPGTYVCSAVAEGYAPNSVGGNVVVRNRRTMVIIPLQPLPGTLYIITIDNSTNQLLPGASVSLTGPETGSGTTGAPDASIQFTVRSGTYGATASASGYSSATNSSFFVAKGGVTYVYLRLNPLPAILIVTVRAADTNQPLVGANVVVRGPTNAVYDMTTAPGPDATLTYTVSVYGLYSASASASGYNPASKTADTPLARNTTVRIELVLEPVPNTVRVTVLDVRTNNPITTATVTLTPGNLVQRVDSPTARTTFTRLGPGAYTATATAPGYGTGSNTTRTLTRNETAEVIIYLGQLQCVVTVNVIDIRSGALIPNPNIILNNPAFTSTSNPATFTIFADDASSASATAAGYRGNDTAAFACTPGGSQNVTLRLNPIIFVYVSAVDTFTPSRPRIIGAQIFAGGQLLTEHDPTVPGRFILELQSIPFTTTINASAQGFAPAANQVRTFQASGGELNISLAPIQFDLFFTPYELFDDGTKRLVGYDGFIANNIRRDGVVTADVYYVPNPKAIGGSAKRTTGDSFPFTPSTIYNSQAALANQTSFNNFLSDFLNGGNVYDPAEDRDIPLLPSDVLVDEPTFASTFRSIVPSSQSPFLLRKEDITGLNANFPTSVGAEITINIPEFTVTSVRNLLIPLPHSINFGFYNIRVTPYNTDGTTPTTFTASEYVTARVNTNAGSNFKNLESPNLANKRAGLFEFPITFGDVLTSVSVAFQGEFFSVEKSGWVVGNTLNPSEVIPDVTSFAFPPQDLVRELFTTAANGQLLRKKSARIYVLKDYRLIRGGTRRRQN